MRQVFALCMLISVAGLSGCRGYISDKEPVHLNPNFDWQPKIKAQRHPHTPPEGSVAWGSGTISDENQSRKDYLKDDSAFYQAKTEAGDPVKKIPIPVTRAVLERGQERYNIYCAVCHNRVGTGQTPVIARGFVPPPDLADPRLVGESDGYIFNVISHGVRTMPSYAKQIPESDRWAIVSYVRAIQKSRTAHIDELPSSLRSKLAE